MSSCDVAAIGWVIALVGLIVNHRLTGQRDTRKEIRGELDKFLVALKVLRDAANDYYFPAKPDTQPKRMALDIHNQFSELDRLVEWLKSRQKGMDLDGDFADLFEMVTGDDFESSAHLPGGHHARKCQDISIKIQTIIAKIEQWYGKHYQR
ncbi:hypothetical protein [Methylovulum psychrotolerans]|uniref:Uncharacterized protein n=1 Tax=Methylovulum psychrotolerans TaxID=1704499 RepID=A0A2S5CQB2_9GAMM|nr:hypothetical protein [Methylovulum psychrotolerans]POZ53011.1 hypothetical protein AADEFJLK_00020 [Methylovulum psychrotolerans]